MLKSRDRETAIQLMEAGSYLWNTNMFAWKIATILQAFRDYQPRCHLALLEIQQLPASGSPLTLELFQKLERRSIDYAIMEKIKPGDACQHIFLKAGFAWDDVGTLESLAKTIASDPDGNRCRGAVEVQDCKNCIFIAEPSVVVRVTGLSNIALFANGEGDVFIGPTTFGPRFAKFRSRTLFSFGISTRPERANPCARYGDRQRG